MKTDFKPTITPKSAAQKLFEYQKKGTKPTDDKKFFNNTKRPAT